MFMLYSLVLINKKGAANACNALTAPLSLKPARRRSLNDLDFSLCLRHGQEVPKKD